MTPFYAVLFKFGSSANYALEHINYFKNEEDAVAYVQRYVNDNNALMTPSNINDMEKTYLNVILKYEVYIGGNLTFTFAIQRLSWSTST